MLGVDGYAETAHRIGETSEGLGDAALDRAGIRETSV
jgi:hypothetical protein